MHSIHLIMAIDTWHADELMEHFSEKWDYYQPMGNTSYTRDYVLPLDPDEVTDVNEVPRSILTPDVGWKSMDDFEETYVDRDERAAAWDRYYWEVFAAESELHLHPFVFDIHS